MEDGYLGQPFFLTVPGVCGEGRQSSGSRLCHIPPRFYSFEHFLKTPKPNHYFHLLDHARVWWGLFLSVAFKFSFLGWEGSEESGNHPSLSCLPLWCSFKGSGWEYTQALGGEDSHGHTPSSNQVLEITSNSCILAALRTNPGRAACVRRPKLGQAEAGPQEGLLLLLISDLFIPSQDSGTLVIE